MQITLPERLNRNSMYKLLRQVVTEEGAPLHDEYIFQMNTCRKFIEPIGVTFINNLVGWLKENEIQVDFSYTTDIEILDDLKEPQRYLDDCGFFEKHIGEKIYKNSSLRSTTVEVQDIVMEEFPSWLNHSFIPWISHTINKPPKELATFKVCLEEIFNNVRDHAMINTSCVFAQHIPGNDNLIISIADMGIGIINHIKSKPNYRHFTDEEAIRSAVRKNFTTQSTPKNRGAGLDMLIYNMVMNAGGTVYIYSNRGILVSSKKNGELKQEFLKADHFYPGTHIEIEINLSSATELLDFEEEEFQW